MTETECAGMTSRRPSSRKIQICSLTMTKGRHPRKYTHCHPQLDWGSRLFSLSFYLKKKYILDSRFRGNDRRCHPRNLLLGIHSNCYPRKNTHCHPRKLLQCHPQLDWGSSVFFLFLVILIFCNSWNLQT